MRKLLVALLATVSVVSPLAAENLRYAPSDWDPDLIDILRDGPAFLARDTKISLPRPPQMGGATEAAEIAILHLRQSYDRTPETITMIREEGDPSATALSVFAVHEKLPDLASVAELEDFLGSVVLETRWFVLSEKWKFQRARPSQVDPTILPALPVPGHASYPSGHAAESRALALVLARLDPACADDYLTLAEEIGDRREIAGLHFPSDSRAGALLADQVVEALLTGPLSDVYATQQMKAVTWRAKDGSCPYGP